MKRMLLIGENGAGKRTLIRRLSGDTLKPQRAMSVEYLGPFMNTPGEFLENRRFYSALITASMDCTVLVLVQDATRRVCLFPPRFAALFNRKVVGVITHADLPGANVERAERFLRQAGVRLFFTVTPKSSENVAFLQDFLVDSI